MNRILAVLLLVLSVSVSFADEPATKSIDAGKPDPEDRGGYDSLPYIQRTMSRMASRPKLVPRLEYARSVSG